MMSPDNRTINFTKMRSR